MEQPGYDASHVLADGRVIEYWDGGAPDGRAMILHPGTPATRVLGRWGHEPAEHAGVRLVSVSRPGYGGSTVTTSEAPSLLAVGRDTAALAAHLGLEEYAVLGISGGGPFAVATAAADPRPVRALGVAGGVGPWRFPDDEALEDDPDERDSFAQLDAGDVAGAWAGYRLLAEREYGRLRSLDDTARVDAILEGDQSSLVHDEGYRTIWTDAIRVVLDGLDGYVFDQLAFANRVWDVDPRDVEAPALLWYGELDEGQLPAVGQWYADRIADSHLTVFPGEGHIDVCDTHWPDVLAGLLRVWG